MEHARPTLRRCATYTRKSSEEGLEQNFNSLHAQREACEAFIKSQASEGWRLVKTYYDDGGVSGASMERPALQRLLGDIRQGLIEVVVVYKVDRLTRSLADFAKMVELFDASRVFGRRHAAVQHHDLDGTAHAQCVALVRAVRARGDRRTNP
jgi:DNA invertase Pin-like site-specific DNA recombinase